MDGVAIEGNGDGRPRGWTMESEPTIVCRQHSVDWGFKGKFAVDAKSF